MKNGTQGTVVAAVTTALVFSGVTSGAADREPRRIVLHVTNHAGTPAEHLDLSRARAESVFADIGVHLEWSSAVTRPGEPHCAGFRLHLILLSTDEAAGTSSPGSGVRVLGISDRATGRAFIYPVRIGVVAERSHTRAGDLLGLVIAHEVGHLLLPAGHSQVGIMALNMETDPTSMRALFTSAQTRAIWALLKSKARDAGGQSTCGN